MLFATLLPIHARVTNIRFNIMMGKQTKNITTSTIQQSHPSRPVSSHALKPVILHQCTSFSVRAWFSSPEIPEPRSGPSWDHCTVGPPRFDSAGSLEVFVFVETSGREVHQSGLVQGGTTGRVVYSRGQGHENRRPTGRELVPEARQDGEVYCLTCAHAVWR